MKIAVVGAGAVGGYLGALLSLNGHEVTVIARGSHLEAIQTQGLTLIAAEGEQCTAYPIQATDDLSQVGVQDLVITAVKGHQLPALAPHLPHLLGPETPLVMAQNGLPWWYFFNYAGPFANRQLKATDPEGVVARHLKIDQVIGCVVYIAAGIQAPGIIWHSGYRRYILGELDGVTSDRIQHITSLIQQVNPQTEITPAIRTEIWTKLLGNIAINTISALTRATQVEVCHHLQTHKLALAMMTEAQQIAQALAIQFELSLTERIQKAAQVGHHRTSMLQDVENRRSLELDAIIGAVIELGHLLEIPTPHLDAIYACLTLLETTLATP